MKYKIGDTVQIIPRKPKNINEPPGWNSWEAMDKYLGVTTTIVDITESGYYRLAADSWWEWRENWLLPIKELSLQEKICNKIKQLDNNWKQKQVEKGNKVCV